MALKLYSITSGLHAEKVKNALEEPFIKGVENALGEKFEYFGEDFSGYESGDMIYVRTGGTEGTFKALGLTGDVRLLTSGESNSLAASMEILSYLRQQGRSGEILHGSPAYIAGRIRSAGSGDAGAGADQFVQPLPPIDLKGIRLGVVGRPSDWLISSGVDYAKAKSRLNAELVDIPMSELLRRLDCPDVDMRGFEGSEAIYSALKDIIAEYRLGGITIRCFDLLDTVHNTGCLALARLNAEGIAASCEGDIPALLSMAYLQQTKGCPGFQCNLSRISGDELLFAHCTVPLNMVSSYRYATHFESGIGTAIKGEIPEEPVEIFKIAPDLEHCVRIPGKILRNLNEKNLCRTQIVVEAKGAAGYFLRRPLANHHIVVNI